MRINDINNLSDKCTGCMACVDICRRGCIKSSTDQDGFIGISIDSKDCTNCGCCSKVCPIIEKQSNTNPQHLYAAYSKDRTIRNRGSSGGMFEELAIYFLKKGYYVCGAAFDDKNQLMSRLCHDTNELQPLLKSKYVQSNMSGMYKKIFELTSKGERMFFCGTPCQVSALVNYLPARLRNNLITADIICHGVPSQQLFDKYIRSIEKKNEEIVRFNFRVKDNRYRHAHGFSYTRKKDGIEETIDGVYTQSTYYNAFKNYCTFRTSCYNCNYATIDRVSDITLGDFWGVEKYGFKGNTDDGVSLVITNSHVGECAFESIKGRVEFTEYPIEYAIESNYSLSHSTKKPATRDKIFHDLQSRSYTDVALTYFKGSLKNRLTYSVYWVIPAGFRRKLRYLRGKK